MKRIKLWILGERGYPEAAVTLPALVMADLPDLIARARVLTPGVSLESVLYTIWRLGSQRLDQNLRRRIPVRVSEIPMSSPSAALVASRGSAAPSRSAPVDSVCERRACFSA